MALMVPEELSMQQCNWVSQSKCSLDENYYILHYVSDLLETKFLFQYVSKEHFPCEGNKSKTRGLENKDIYGVFLPR